MKKRRKDVHIGKTPARYERHPIFRQHLTRGQKAADKISTFGGSWTFLAVFFIFLAFWIGINSWYLLSDYFDPYPFILLNLILSCLAAVQAPVILMSQNRQAERDRIDAKYDHQINRKAEREIQYLHKRFDDLEKTLRKK